MNALYCNTVKLRVVLWKATEHPRNLWPLLRMQRPHPGKWLQIVRMLKRRARVCWVWALFWARGSVAVAFFVGVGAVVLWRWLIWRK